MCKLFGMSYRKFISFMFVAFFFMFDCAGCSKICLYVFLPPGFVQ